VTPLKAGRRAAQLLEMMQLLRKTVHTSMAIPHLHLKANLTLAQMTVLGIVHAKGPLSMHALAEHNQVAMPTMSEMVGRLVRCGLINRVPDSQDRRVIQVVLTARGKKLFDDKIKLAQATMTSLLKGLDDREQVQIMKAFETITHLISKSTQERKRPS